MYNSNIIYYYIQYVVVVLHSISLSHTIIYIGWVSCLDYPVLMYQQQSYTHVAGIYYIGTLVVYTIGPL